MPDIMAHLVQQPQVTSPTPWTPDMQKQYDGWRQQQIAQKVAMFSKMHNSAIQSTDGKAATMPKLDKYIQYYQQDSPALRQEFQASLQPPPAIAKVK